VPLLRRQTDWLVNLRPRPSAGFANRNNHNKNIANCGKIILPTPILQNLSGDPNQFQAIPAGTFPAKLSGMKTILSFLCLITVLACSGCVVVGRHGHTEVVAPIVPVPPPPVIVVPR
jgi:hypothetical protein